MAVLLVAYELNTKDKDYEPLFEAIKKGSNGWMHYIDNVWIVNTNQSADQFGKALYKFITKADRLFVAKLSGEHQGWLPSDAWKWLNERTY